MDFEAIADFWFGEVKEPQFPLEPIDLGAGLQYEPVEFINPFEPLPKASKETPESEEEV